MIPTRTEKTDGNGPEKSPKETPCYTEDSSEKSKNGSHTFSFSLKEGMQL